MNEPTLINLITSILSNRILACNTDSELLKGRFIVTTPPTHIAHKNQPLYFCKKNDDDKKRQDVWLY